MDFEHEREKYSSRVFFLLILIFAISKSSFYLKKKVNNMDKLFHH